MFITVPSANHNLEDIKKKKLEDYDYIDWVIDACDKNKYNLYIISKNNVRYYYDNGVLNIDDMMTDASFSLDNTNIKDTIIFQGQNNSTISVIYKALMQLFEKLGYFIINPIDAIINASDKYLSSVLMSKYNIPQPNYLIVNKDDIEDELGIVKSDFFTKLHSIYKSNPNISNSIKEYTYVCKILNGSLGIGVFLCNENEILSILQTLITIDPQICILIQEFKKNTGDIRAHAFSFDGKNYEIIAAMKRNKIDGDFRSNVSLGADTNAIELTKEQQKIILDTAKMSGCRWVGVDLMECEDQNKNKENVVIEYNSSPGVNGISLQIKKNLFEVIFEKINQNLKGFKTVDENNNQLNETVQVDDKVKTEEGNYAFNNIILFTGPKDDAQILLKEICDTSNIKLYKFNPEEVEYKINDKSLSIKDKSKTLDIDYDKVSQKNTIVFSRVMPDKAEKLEDLYSKLYKDNFLFFNKKHGIELAGDKYKTAELFKKHRIAQPKYVLVDKNDVIKEDVKLFDKLKEIYSDAEKDKTHKYVVKNPTGGQGIGVFCVDGSQILAVLQAYFDVAEDKKLLVQEFMDADGGDFRVHVLNLKSGKYILAAMKRDKIEGDFRSNVSLGAKTEEIKLTKEQEELAIKAAEAMELNWVGVDIMPVKNNKEKNVVIECNSGAGVAGISNMLGKNLFNLMFEKITKEDLG